MPRYHGGDLLDPDNVSMENIDHVFSAERVDGYIEGIQFGGAVDKQFRKKLKKRATQGDASVVPQESAHEAGDPKAACEAAGPESALEAGDPKAACEAAGPESALEADETKAALSDPDHDDDDDLSDWEVIVKVEGKSAAEELALGLGPHGFLHNSPTEYLRSHKIQAVKYAQGQAMKIFKEGLLEEDKDDKYVASFADKEDALRKDVAAEALWVFDKLFKKSKALSKYGVKQRAHVRELKEAFDQLNPYVETLIQDAELTNAALLTSQRDVQYYQALNRRQERAATDDDMKNLEALKQDITSQMAAYDSLATEAMNKIIEARSEMELRLEEAASPPRPDDKMCKYVAAGRAMFLVDLENRALDAKAEDDRIANERKLQAESDRERIKQEVKKELEVTIPEQAMFSFAKEAWDEGHRKGVQEGFQLAKKREFERGWNECMEYYGIVANE